eukprot:6192017-Pleurochrysis_carterae.AAC.1
MSVLSVPILADFISHARSMTLHLNPVQPMKPAHEGTKLLTPVERRAGEKSLQRTEFAVTVLSGPNSAQPQCISHHHQCDGDGASAVTAIMRRARHTESSFFRNGIPAWAQSGFADAVDVACQMTETMSMTEAQWQSFRKVPNATHKRPILHGNCSLWLSCHAQMRLSLRSTTRDRSVAAVLSDAVRFPQKGAH